MKKRIGILLALAICAALLPWSALASEEPGHVDMDYPEEVIAEEPAEETELPVTDAETDVIEYADAEELQDVQPEPEETPVEAEESAVGVEAQETLKRRTEGPIQTVGDTAVPGGANNDALFEGYVSGLFGLRSSALMGGYRAAHMAASDRLTGMTRIAYGLLVQQIWEVAEGERSSTVFTIPVEWLGLPEYWTAEDLGVDQLLYSFTENGDLYVDITAAAQNALDEIMYINLDQLISALLADLPYELYWYDKTADTNYSGYEFNFDWYWDPEVGTDLTRSRVWVLGELTFSLPVASDYARSTYSVDQTRAARAQAAAKNARDIVTKYRDYGDVEKLRAFKREICSLVTYNDAAAAGYMIYGDPWQLVYVFDGDPTTNVVCEGYAKAFQYLCDVAAFQGSIRCLTVTGGFDVNSDNVYSLGSHMWNVLIMDDGNSYLADVTNCDEGSVGADDYLFLVPCLRWDQQGGFYFACGQDWVYYLYDFDTWDIFPSDELFYSLEPYGQAPRRSVRGDFNGDGAVNRQDRVYLGRALAGWPGYEIPKPEIGDLNEDGAVNRQDRVFLGRALAGWPGYLLDIGVG
mgnify:CR=1 FL=1